MMKNKERSLVKQAKLSAEVLRELLSFDPESGKFFWRTSHRGHAREGTQAGGISKQTGYSRIKIGQEQYMAHRLAWFYVHGEWPSEDIDHINGQRADNRMANLRDVSCRTNRENRRTPTTRTGFLGVTRRNLRSGPRYRALITAQGKPKHLGVFDTPEQAHAAYISAKREHHAGCTI